MLKKIKTLTDEVVYINEEMVAYIKKIDPTVTDRESNWRVHLADDDETSFDMTYEQMKRKPR